MGTSASRVRRRWRHRLLGLVLDLRPGAIEPTVARRRFAPTPWGCARAVIHAGRVVAWSGILLSLGLGAAVAALAPGVALAVALLPTIVGAAGLLSIAAHEVGHLGAVRAVGGRPRYAAAGTNQVGLIHDVSEVGRRRRVAIAGPLAGAVAALVAWPLIAALPAPADDLALPTAVLLSAGHLTGLLPWLTDGRHLWAAAR